MRIVAHHLRTGVVALNVVTAALETDPVTAGLDVRFSKSAEETARLIAEAHGPVVVLWSFFTLDFARCRADLERVRAAGPTNALHVAGGAHATAEPEEVLRAGFDLVAIGEGEATGASIVRDVVEGRDPQRAAPGRAYLRDGRFVSHGPGERRPLDDFPAINARHGKWNPIEITRGCVYACSFCQTPYMFKARFRHRSVESVRETVRATWGEGGRYVRFLTPSSLSYGSDGEEPNLDAVEALLAGVRGALGPRGKCFFGTFPSEVRPEHVTPRALAIIERWADNRTLAIGGQSGSDRVLAATRRGHDVGSVILAVEACVARGFRPDVDLLFGLPGETLEDRRATLALAERLVAMGARIHNHAFMPLPGTPLASTSPEPLEPEVTRAFGRLEGKGALYGQWRDHLVHAAALVRR